jgi:formate dehydrogenase alpha subunit
MTNPISDIKDAACIFVIGSNTTVAHPVIALEIKKAVRKGSKLIVADPRKIDIAKYADIWLGLCPGSDTALLMGMMKIICDEGLADKKFISECCINFEAFKESLIEYNLDFVERVTGVPRNSIVEAARLFATSKPATILYCLGITEHTHGTDNVFAIADLAMLTGNIGKPASGVNPLRGQNNVQGACDMGALPNVYPGYQSVNNPEIKNKFEKAWGCTLDPTPGKTLPEILDATGNGEIKSIYIIGENPILSEADVQHTERALKKVEFLVVQDIFLTETAKLADVILPSASFAEEEGTFTNTERRIQRVRKVIEPVGNSRPDWLIVSQLANKMGAVNFSFRTPNEVMEEIAAVTPSYGGIAYERLETCGLQWPCPTKDHPGTPILHVDKFACGLGRFTPVKYRAPAELPDEEYPMILTTGRHLYHFHTGTMTRKVAGLNAIDPEGLIEISPADASELDIKDGERIKVMSRRGEVIGSAKISKKLQPKIIFMSFHFAETAANILTNSALDPVSKTPEFKVCAVKIQKVIDQRLSDSIINNFCE